MAIPIAQALLEAASDASSSRGAHHDRPHLVHLGRRGQGRRRPDSCRRSPSPAVSSAAGGKVHAGPTFLPQLRLPRPRGGTPSDGSLMRRAWPWPTWTGTRPTHRPGPGILSALTHADRRAGGLRPTGPSPSRWQCFVMLVNVQARAAAAVRRAGLHAVAGAVRGGQAAPGRELRRDAWVRRGVFQAPRAPSRL